MALPNLMIFGLLCLEVALFLLLVAPMPFTWRRSLFKFLSTSPLIAKLQFGLRTVFIFVAVLFADSVQRMLKVHQEGVDAKHQGAGAGRDLRSETDWRSRKFLSERDFYLRGFTLFLSLILSRVFSLVIDLIKAQEDLAALRKSSNSSAREAGIKDQDKEANYKRQIADLQREVDSLGAKVSGPGAGKKD